MENAQTSKATAPQHAETGWRGSREGWLDAAYDMLIREGVDAVKILPLAQGLKLSRTSFYWFFENRDALLGALADMWQARTTTPLCEATHAYAESETEAMLNVIGCFLRPETFDAKLEFAMRGWGLKDPAIMARIVEADRLRLDALIAMLTRWGHSPQDADVRATTIYLVQIGYISMRLEESLEVRVARIPNYVEIYTGHPPEPREIARFRGRFGLPPEA
ncbi:MAG: TetR/AcrR family transcriptional regulator [Paracoccaceae bacterium]|nr:TetR/AcrR family transcriptional regulator [Paracoccaceae bacterium]